MKRDKVLKIGYDGHSEFITIETDNHGWGKILDICKHESFHKVDIFGAYRLAGYVFVVDAKNSIKRMEAELINPFFCPLDDNYYNGNASMLIGTNIYGNAYVVKAYGMKYGAFSKKDMGDLARKNPFTIDNLSEMGITPKGR